MRAVGRERIRGAKSVESDLGRMVRGGEGAESTRTLQVRALHEHDCMRMPRMCNARVTALVSRWTPYGAFESGVRRPGPTRPALRMPSDPMSALTAGRSNTTPPVPDVGGWVWSAFAITARETHAPQSVAQCSDVRVEQQRGVGGPDLRDAELHDAVTRVPTCPLAVRRGAGRGAERLRGPNGVAVGTRGCTPCPGTHGDVRRTRRGRLSVCTRHEVGDRRLCERTRQRGSGQRVDRTT